MVMGSPPLLRIKVFQVTRDMTAGSGSVAYTGVGFKPRCLLFFGAKAGATATLTVGCADESKTIISMTQNQADSTWADQAYIYAQEAAGVYQVASVVSYDTDGFTLNWVKSGVPAAGNFKVVVVCLR